MTYIPSNLVRVGLFLLLLLPHGFAQELTDSYLPLSKAETARRFPLKYEGTFTRGELDPEEKPKPTLLPERVNIGVAGAQIAKQTTEDSEELTITGQDKNGKDWSVMLGGTTVNHGFRFYSADLDKNGIRDGVILAATMGNGTAPTMHITTLTFDESGRPILFEIEGYFHAVKDGIFDVVDMDRDGAAEIIYLNHSDGYWVTNIYECSNARWTRVNGKHAERKFPLYTRFTNRPNRVAVTPKVGRNPESDDLSNATARISGQLLSYKWADVNASEDIVLKVKTSTGKTIECSPTSWYSSFSVVIDKPEGRRIVQMSVNEKDFKAALDEVVNGKYEVAFFGQRGKEQISPEMLWATTK
ncbi:MAG: hypothetical protein JST84_25825 [Acidobacteria bacterium]|nr:hypothetical protein [Acidobacteriota bacterium]